MIKRELSYYSSRIKKEIGRGEGSVVFLLKDGRILKLFDISNLLLFKKMGYDLEKTILSSEKYQIPVEIKKPVEAIYQSGIFCGYIMKAARGISFNERDEKLTIEQRRNLHDYAILHNNLEKVIKKSDEFVFPDLLTCDNIFVDRNLNIELIDFDGMQVGDNKTMVISTSLGNTGALLKNPKYCDRENFLFKKELDIKSLIHLYFLDTFNVDLSKVGVMNPMTNTRVTLEDIFISINLHDYDLMDKVWKVFQKNKQNEYLGEDVFRIAEDCKMSVMKNPFVPNTYVKKLVRK